MAVLIKARSLSSSGGARPTCYVFRQQGSQPVAALVSARRSYWFSRGPKSKDTTSNASSVYNYMKAYPHRTLPHYIKHIDDLQYAYIESLARSRDQSSRQHSNWASKERQNDKGKHTSKAQETPWETRTRIAGERYLRLMEVHMSLLRKDPYWGLFGASELRGVWNPWKNLEPLRRRVDEKTWKAWEESKKAADVLRRTVKGEFWEETDDKTRSSTGQRPPVYASKRSPPNTPENEYVYDPISNKRVRRASVEQPSDMRLGQTPLSAATEDLSKSRSIDIPAGKDQPQGLHMTSLKPKAIISPVETKEVHLAGFASQPWLTKKGYQGPHHGPHSIVVDNYSSVFAKDRALLAQRKLQREQEAKKQAQRDIDDAVSSPNSKLDASQPPIEVINKRAPADKPAQHPNTTRLRSSLYRTLQSSLRLRYDEASDKRENLDLLRPETIRESVAKPAHPPNAQSKLTAQQRWAFLEDTAAKTFQRREDRLLHEFAASKWDLKRNWSSYPGDIAKTPEEFRNRRQLLEQSFNRSADLLELQVARTLGKVVPPTEPKSGTYEHSATGAKAKDSNSAQIAQRKAQRQTEIAALLQKRVDDQKAAMVSSLQKEVDAQKNAMTMYENRARSSEVAKPSNSLSGTTVRALSEQVERSLDQKVKERALVREIRDIYESTYGVIDTRHRQTSLTSGRPASIEGPKSVEPVQTGSSEQKSVPRKVSTIPPYQASSQSTMDGHGNVPNDNASGTVRRNAPAKKSIPVISSGTELYPFDSIPEPEASKQIEESVRKFENIMSANGPTHDTSKAQSNANAETRGSGWSSASSEVSTDMESMDPISQQAGDNLTAELATIAAEAPVAKSAAQTGDIPATTANTAPRSYILLAFNKHEGKVRVTSASSGLHEDHAPKRTVESIMSRLVEPSAYFEHMDKLDKAGYELVAGGRQMLVYKDVCGQRFNPNAIADEPTGAPPERGWGSPSTEEPTKTSTEQPQRRSRPVKRVEESFSGVPPRLESDRIADEIEETQKKYKGPVWKVLRAGLLVGVLFYSFGVTLEWLKDKEKRKLIEDYQKEVKRVQEIERKKAQEQSKGFGWGF